MKPTSVRPMNVTRIAGTNRPGAMKSTTRMAAASRIAAMTGANRASSLAVIGRLLPQPEGDRRGLLDRAQRLLDGALDELEDQPGVEAEHDDQHAQRDERHRLDRLEVRDMGAEALEEVADLAE